MSAVNTLGHNVEQMFGSHGWIPLSLKPHDTADLARDELKALIGQPGERRVYEALELHPKEAARIAIARAAMLSGLKSSIARYKQEHDAIDSGVIA